MWDDFSETLKELETENRLRRLVPREIVGVELIEKGRRLVNFGSNDYLGLASLRESEHVAFTPHPSDPIGATSSSLVCGWTEHHQRLADQIAEFEQTEAAVIFPTGYAACSGTIATLTSSDDLLLSDQLNHASLIDGCRLSKATRIIYPHRDVDFVSDQLARLRQRHKRAWIVTDGVFSMDGHLAPLEELCELAEHFDATLIVDEAHGTGVLGEHGRGACELLNVKDRVAIRIGTLSKAVGSQGGFVAAPRVIINYLVNRCRSLIFSTALSLPAVAAAQHSIDRITSAPWRRHRVQSLASQTRERLSLPADQHESIIPIVPILIGSDAEAVELSSRLADRGIFVPAIRPPTVPTGASRLRISLSAAHSDEMIDQLIRHLSAS
jgi:8-amino-7-oxononanoate synthase